MGKKVRVFLGEKDIAQLLLSKNCKNPTQDCYFCDLLDCREVQANNHKLRLGLVRLYGKDISVYYSPQEGCWLPYTA